MAEPAARAVISDDGTIWLTAYGDDGAVVPVALAPVRAMHLGHDLIAAGLRRFGDQPENSSPRSGRGGDQFAEKRQQRGEGLVELTAMQPGETERARIRAAQSKLERYAANAWPQERDKPEVTGNQERDLLRKIMRTGLPMVRERQHREILRAHKKK